MTKPDSYVLLETGIPERLVAQAREMIDSGKYIAQGGIAVAVTRDQSGTERLVYLQALVANPQWRP